MKKQRSREHTALCLLAWSCLKFTLSEALESLATTPSEETSIKKILRDAANQTTAQANLSVHCTALLPPNDGFYYIETGSGSSLGSVVMYWCMEGYQLVGNRKLICLLKGSVSYWSDSPPHCEVIPKPLDKGFRMAVIASLISGLIIVAMSIAFAVCCLRDRMLKGAPQRSKTSEEQQSRKRFKLGRSNSTKQEIGKTRNHFGKMKHNRRLHYRTSAFYSCAHPGAMARYRYQGLQRRQENLPKGAPQSLCSEIHIYPQVVLKPGTVPSASMFVHLPQEPAIPLSMTPGYPNLPQDIPSIYYRQFEGLGHLDKY